MRLTSVLYRQNVRKWFIKHWFIQGKRTIEETPAKAILEQQGIRVCEPDEVLKVPFEKVQLNIVGMKPLPTPIEQHPNWHDRICHTYKDNNVLLEGLEQAKVLTKTVQIGEGLPEQLTLKNSSKEIDNKVKRVIMHSHLFDAEQKKLPKIKDPMRPAFNFPRVYGISESRVNKILLSDLIQLLESNSPSVANERYLFDDLCFKFPYERNGDLIQFDLKGDTILTSSKMLPPVTKQSTEELNLPNLFPIKETNTLNLDQFYEAKTLFPINPKLSKSHPHTVFVHFNSQEVKNIYEEEVNDVQIYGRSLMKTFTVAAAYARQKFGEEVKVLPKPVTLQCVQTDGRWFHFGTLQLNTLDLENSEGIKNLWYQTPKMYLFTSCAYVMGKPTLDGYNSDVIKHLLTFYQNV